MEDHTDEQSKTIPVERVIAPDLRPIYVTSAAGELTQSFGMIQFQLDRPVFKLTEDNKSVAEKIIREVLVELHMSYGVWKAIGSFMMKKSEQIEASLQSSSATEAKLQQNKKWIQDHDVAQSETRAKRIIEIESPELIGKGYPPPLVPDKVPQEIQQTYFDLQGSIDRIWTEARMSYVYGFFQSCTFLVGAILELLIEQFLRLRKAWPEYERRYRDPKSRWLGTLVKFCEDEKLLDESILEAAYRINALRKEAVHMVTEKLEYHAPADAHPLVELEEGTVVRSREGKPSIEIESLPGQPVILDLSDPRRPVWKRMLVYKPQATEAFQQLSKVFWALRQGKNSA